MKKNNVKRLNDKNINRNMQLWILKDREKDFSTQKLEFKLHQYKRQSSID